MPEIRTEIVVDAPSERCWEVLTDFARYGEWNPAIAKIEGPAELDGALALSLRVGERRLGVSVRIDVFDEGVALQWRGGASGLPWLVDVAHFFRLEPLGEQTRFVHGERFDGAVPWLVWPVLGRLVRPRYPVVNEAFRKRCERTLAL